MQEYNPPSGRIYDERSSLFRKLQTDDDYLFARTCKYFGNSADSFNRWMACHCHHDGGRVITERLADCRRCHNYAAYLLKKNKEDHTCE